MVPASVGAVKVTSNACSVPSGRVPPVNSTTWPSTDAVNPAWSSAEMPLTPSGKDASAAHLTWDDRQLKRGEGTYFEIAGCYRRYHAPLSRTLFLGEPPEAMKRAQDAVFEGLAAGLEARRMLGRAGAVAADT